MPSSATSAFARLQKLSSSPWAKPVIAIVGALGIACVGMLYTRFKNHQAPPPSAAAIALSKTMQAGIAEQRDMEYPLPYRLFIPKDYNPQTSYPLVVFLHAVGSEGIDNIRQLGPSVKQLTTFAQTLEPSFVLAPQCAPNHKWVSIPPGAPYLNYSQNELPETDALKMTKAVILELQKQYSIDADRLYVTGPSAGGAGVWDIISRDTTIPFAAALPFSGAYDPSSASNIANMPIWIFHGADDTVSPSANMFEAAAALKALGSPVKHTELAGIGHNSWHAHYQEAKVYTWLFAQRRSSWDKSSVEAKE